MTKYEALKKYFGYTQFRPAQETVIDALLSGSDVMAIMPTGAGKSLCFQIPALLFDGVTIVVSPLISLMKDQVARLRLGDIPVAFINSSLTQKQYNEVLRRVAIGQYKIIYVAPERLNTADFLRFALETPISFAAIDEAHCVSQWGQDFRPSYLKIADFIGKLKTRPVIGAFTATATNDVKKDIIRFLGIKNPVCLTTGFDRPNLYFGVEKPKDKRKRFFEIVNSHSLDCGIIYCSTRNAVNMVYNDLLRNGMQPTRYHAGLDDAERRLNQEDFISGKKPVVVATNAFGMGIDKPDVRYVLHYNMPKNLENYYQEAGRAGRDGDPSECILLFADEDIKTSEFFINKSGEVDTELDILSPKERRKVQLHDIKRLDSITRYCETTSCLRKYILRYFGDKQKQPCGNCSNCLKPGFWKSLL